MSVPDYNGMVIDLSRTCYCVHKMLDVGGTLIPFAYRYYRPAEDAPLVVGPHNQGMHQYDLGGEYVQGSTVLTPKPSWASGAPGFTGGLCVPRVVACAGEDLPCSWPWRINARLVATRLTSGSPWVYRTDTNALIIRLGPKTVGAGSAWVWAPVEPDRTAPGPNPTIQWYGYDAADNSGTYWTMSSTTTPYPGNNFVIIMYMSSCGVAYGAAAPNVPPVGPYPAILLGNTLGANNSGKDPLLYADCDPFTLVDTETWTGVYAGLARWVFESA